MLIYNKIAKSYLYFVHIPRTGGRFINEIFKNDNIYQTFFENYNDLYKNIEIPHLIYPHYLNLSKFFIKYDNQTNFDIKNIPHFTVIRNPFDKFKSEIKGILKNKSDLDSIIELDKNELEKMINKIINLSNNNWFVPQSFFISPQTKIWNYENGISVEFVKWIKKEFNFDIKNMNMNIEYSKSHYDYTELDLNVLEKIKPFIEEIYKDDYIKFGYELTK